MQNEVNNCTVSSLFYLKLKNFCLRYQKLVRGMYSVYWSLDTLVGAFSLHHLSKFILQIFILQISTPYHILIMEFDVWQLVVERSS